MKSDMRNFSRSSQAYGRTPKAGTGTHIDLRFRVAVVVKTM